VRGNLEQKRHAATTLIETFRNDWARLATARTRDERADIHDHMRYCLEELMGLVRDLEADNA
jgi:hypothetical protein